MIIRRTYTFEAAHRLPKVAPGHKCRATHGHSYTVVVEIDGPIRSNGMVVDFGKVDEVVCPYIEQMDHSYLNELEGLQNPTAEVISMWVWDRVVKRFPNLLAAVEVQETQRGEVRYEGD